MTVDLILIGGEHAPSFAWSAGRILHTRGTLAEVRSTIASWLQTSAAEGVLLWDPRLGRAPEDLAVRLLEGRGDVWHAGLALGTAGSPGLVDFVRPSRMLYCDPPVDREATSWRATFAACLVRRAVFEQLGPPSGDFETLEGAVLEWGHRCITWGALMRHVPVLAGASVHLGEPASLTDEVRFVAYQFGRAWARWAVARAGLSGYASPLDLMKSLRLVGDRPYAKPRPYTSGRSLGEPELASARVTVLIPSLNRQKYLHIVLDQLRAQTVRPAEIIIVDQTPVEARDPTLATTFSDLPLRLMFQDEPGQCASRNAGLQVSTGDYVLFIDDDDEIPPTLIEQHLRTLHRFAADSSSGVAIEVGSAAPGSNEAFVRASGVFPTGNTLARRRALLQSGLFDLAYNRAPRADGDLGMRLYLSGALMVFDPTISVLHHRAAEGGLRVHGARVVTYRMSREGLAQRHLPHVSEIYLASRYFSQRQQREMLWLRTLGTLSGRGGLIQRMSKIVVGGLMLPDTVKQTLARRRAAREWLERFPQIEQLRE